MIDYRTPSVVSYPELVFRGVANRRFFAFNVGFVSQCEEIEPALFGMSLTTLGKVPRTSSRLPRVAVARSSDWLILQCSCYQEAFYFFFNQGPHFVQLLLLFQENRQMG